MPKSNLTVSDNTSNVCRYFLIDCYLFLQATEALEAARLEVSRLHAERETYEETMKKALCVASALSIWKPWECSSKLMQVRILKAFSCNTYLTITL